MKQINQSWQWNFSNELFAGKNELHRQHALPFEARLKYKKQHRKAIDFEDYFSCGRHTQGERVRRRAKEGNSTIDVQRKYVVLLLDWMKNEREFLITIPLFHIEVYVHHNKKSISNSSFYGFRG